MRFKVVPTASFEYDYMKALNYLKHETLSPSAHKHLIEEMDKASSLLSLTPYMHAVSNKPPLSQHYYREHFLLTYAIVYRIEKDNVYLLRLFHQKQDYGNLL